MKQDIKSLLSDYKYTYSFFEADYNLQLMRDCNLIILEVHEDINGRDYVYIATHTCCDFWFY
jgi:hypothetical protein